MERFRVTRISSLEKISMETTGITLLKKMLTRKAKRKKSLSRKRSRFRFLKDQADKSLSRRFHL